MFGFKKKDNKIKDMVVYNLDDEPVIDRSTGEFLMDLDYEQQSLIRLFLDYKIEVRSFAYKGLPASYMREIQQVILPDNNGAYSIKPFDEAVLYRIVHTDLDFEQFQDCLFAMIRGVDMCAEIEDIADYPHEILNIVALASDYGANLCRYVTHDMDFADLQEAARDVLYKHKKKEEAQARRSDFFYNKILGM